MPRWTLGKALVAALPLGVVLAGSVSAVAFGIISRLYLPEIISYIAPLLSFVLGLMAAGFFLQALKTERAQAGKTEEKMPALKDVDDAQDNDSPEGGPDASSGCMTGNVIAFQTAPRIDARAELILSELSHYPLFTDILSKQMRSVTEVSEGAAKGILENLTDIDNQITSLLGFIQQSGSNDQAASVVAEIEKQTQMCRDQLDLFASQQEAGAQKGRSQRSKIASETAKVMEVLDGVSGVARQTTMLSLNVSIEAARAGEAGRGFAIIGEEIRKLAGEVQDLAKQVRDRVESLARIVTVELRKEAEERDQADRRAFANIGATLNALTDNLLTLITHQRDILSKVETGNESIAQPLLKMMGSIQFQDIIRQQLEHVVSMAEMVDEHLRSVGTLLPDPEANTQTGTLAQKLDNLFGTYVMESQRANHRSVQGVAVAQDACAKIELF